MADYINQDNPVNNRGLVSITGFDIGGLDNPEMRQLTVKEIILGESLLTPGLQTSVTLQNSIYIPEGKNFDKFKSQPVRFVLSRDLTAKENLTLSLGQGTQIVYRMDNRGFKPVNVGQTEEFTIHACHWSLLEDAKALMSKSFKCKKPISDVATKALQCIGVNPVIDSDDKNRDFIAENIHPFQVVAQQINVGLHNGNPDYLHYMTYENGGTHYIKSLSELCRAGAVWTFEQSETGEGGLDNPANGGYGNPKAVISMEFPCDFDVLIDILNGATAGGSMNTVATFNPSNSQFNASKAQGDCGIGGYNYKVAITNKGSEKVQDACKDGLDVETHLLKRQAIMSLLDRDRIALRMVVPWNPLLHAGKVIKLDWKNKYNREATVYGDGEYLITSMMHTVRLGGFSTTSIDCVSTSVAGGIV